MSKGSKSRRDRRRKQELRERNRQPTQTAAQAEPQTSKASTQRASIDFTKLGAPGIQHELYIVGGPAPDLAASRERSKAVIRDSEEREFRIIAHLGKEPGSYSREVNITLETAAGASLIQAHPDADLMAIETTFGMVNVHINASREFSALELRCRAQNSREVFARYSDALATLIDHISFHHDVPLFIRYVAIWDEKNNVLTASYVTPYPSVLITGDWLVFDIALSPYYALYREALTNSSVFYQFLCYAKILEGIVRKTYPEIIREAKANGLAAPRLDARVVDDPEIRGPARDWVGKAIQQTFNDYLQPEFRNAIAHFSNADEDPLVVSNYIVGATMSNNILLARQCARGAITDIERIIRELKGALGLAPKWMK